MKLLHVNPPVRSSWFFSPARWVQSQVQEALAAQAAAAAAGLPLAAQQLYRGYGGGCSGALPQVSLLWQPGVDSSSFN